MALLGHEAIAGLRREHAQDWSSLRVVVPTAVHIPLLKAALALHLPATFIPPRITTLSAWTAMLPPDSVGLPRSDSERLMHLYAELRQHAWLKKIFSARRNTDLLPLAHTLLCLCDELTKSLLPAMKSAPGSVEARWHAALAQLQATDAQHMLSDEAQLVWTIWQSQLDGNDACSMRFKSMMQLAECADGPLVWISPVEADNFEQAFLDAYAKKNAVLPITLDWRAEAVSHVFRGAWQELLQGSAFEPTSDMDGVVSEIPQGLAIYDAKSLEDEAVHGAQTIIDWLASGKTRLAIVAQDRVVARRIRALLERAHVYVADETGWKLSTTRAAAAVSAWFDVVTMRAETLAMLNLLKSPFIFASDEDKSNQVMAMELALRRDNVLGGWKAIATAVERLPVAQQWISSLALQARTFAGKKTLVEWSIATGKVLDALCMRDALQADPAGQQIIQLLDRLGSECRDLEENFSLPEWRAFFSMQMESTEFALQAVDKRVAMLPLNGAHLRSFDAVLLVGADADHLPSQQNETLFFANAVRRELGLATRESRQRQQLRDFTELLSVNQPAVLSWQASRDGEPNPVSPWIKRLELFLERSGAGSLPRHATTVPKQTLNHTRVEKPAPVAPQLLPKKLSASGYNSFVQCPYQFFATRMLGLATLEELSDMPQKRDYGDWLHDILSQFHATLRQQETMPDEREDLLRKISDQVFSDVFGKSGAALGYYTRWQKAIPAYLDWAAQREAQGWFFAVGEKWLEKTISWVGGEITLHGRVDRIDENANGERAILDYKTKNVQALRDRLKQVEDHQLAFYGLLSDVPAAAGHYVALEQSGNKTGDAEAIRYAEWQQALAEQIAASMAAIQQGVALQATGIELICQYCDVRGLCRKGAW